jgi:hypothetical protein
VNLLPLKAGPSAGWELIPVESWPRRLPCFVCDGNGRVSFYRPTRRQVQDHTDRDEWGDCAACNGRGSWPLHHWSDDPAGLLQYGYRWEEDVLWRKQP